VARFEREAQLLASLNHPNIGSIYGLEDAGAVPALVLELVEGDTLAERSLRGSLPPLEALAIAQQIADALDAAERRRGRPGVVAQWPHHRVRLLAGQPGVDVWSLAGGFGWKQLAQRREPRSRPCVVA
jgi:serine/threonine protein kinase